MNQKNTHGLSFGSLRTSYVLSEYQIVLGTVKPVEE